MTKAPLTVGITNVVGIREQTPNDSFLNIEEVVRASLCTFHQGSASGEMVSRAMNHDVQEGELVVDLPFNFKMGDGRERIHEIQEKDKNMM